MREGKPYPVKAFLVFGNNTLTTYANTSQVYESLMKLDFMVCADLFMTPTAELADIVLPAASWPEINQLAGLPTVAANIVVANQKSVRIGECKSDEEIFVELARRMKLPVGTEAVEDVLDAQLAAGGVGMTFDEIKQKGFYKVPFKYRKYENGGFKTPTGKIELYATRFEQMGYAPLPSYEEPPESPISAPEIAADFPLVLTTGGRISYFFNSEHRQIDKTAQGAARSGGGNPSRHGGAFRHRQRGVDVDRDQARQDPAKGQADDGNRPARHPRPARLVVSRTAGAGLRRLDIECQSVDRQQAALRPGDGHLPVARAVV